MTLDAQVADAAVTCFFSDMPLAPFLQETIRSIGYETPTPIQSQSIPVALAGEDLVGLAQTGTGKTAAFVIPLIQKLSGRKERATRALVLAPTRELAEQINEVISEISQRSGLKSVTVYGGVSHQGQVSKLRSHPQIVVACPGRLKDHMRGGTIDLSGIECLVLDEADRMLDMGFLPDIREIIRAIPEDRQTMLFSATMPDEIKKLSREILRKPVTIQVKTEAPVATVSHSLYTLKQEEKADRLSTWLSENPGTVTVVFTKMKHTAKKLAEKLAKSNIRATSLQGNLSQGKRQRALNGFRDGTFQVLIATDIASRGIDVDGITHVINYDMPDTLDAYIHRTGRAGRASRSGDAVTFATRADRVMVREIESWLGTPLSRLNQAGLEGDDASSDISAPARRRATPRNERRRPRPGRRERSEGKGQNERGANFSERPASGMTEEGEAPRRSERPRSFDRRPSRGAYDRRPSDRNDRFDRDRGERRQERSAGFRRGEDDQRAFKPRGERRSDTPRRDSNSRGEERQRSFAPRGERGFERRREDRPQREENRSGDRRPRSSRGPQRDGEFRGQRDIDPNSRFVYRPKGSHFIDRRDSEERGRRPRFDRGSRPRGPRR